jgi:6-pyruvoyltetrahydropterin/6-carboxytetrahydropterin synthase
MVAAAAESCAPKSLRAGAAPRYTVPVLVRKQFSFEAAHALPHHPGKCARPHGHSYRLDVAVGGTPAPSGPSAGMVVDFDEISRAVDGVILPAVDHHSLNDLMENPTSELLALWIWQRLAPLLPGLAEIVLWETATACAVVRAADVAERPAAAL